MAVANSCKKRYGSSTNNIEVKLNDDLVRVNGWLIVNKLTLNSSKTEFMLIGSRLSTAKAKYVSNCSLS
jgi:hypothetical protein